MGWKKGQSGNPKGRPKGAKGKTPKSLKDDFMAAYNAAGGIRWLKKMIKSKPELFLQLLAKLLPKETSVAVSGLSTLVLEFQEDTPPDDSKATPEADAVPPEHH